MSPDNARWAGAVGCVPVASPFCFAWDARSLANEEDGEDEEDAGTQPGGSMYRGNSRVPVRVSSSYLNTKGAVEGNRAIGWTGVRKLDLPVGL